MPARLARVRACIAALSIGWFLLITAAVNGQTPRAGNVCGPLNPAETMAFATQTTSVGVIDLHFFLAQGPVTYYECVDDQPHLLGTSSQVNGNLTSLLGAVPWSCDRPARRFAATTTLLDGRVMRGLASSRTRSCAKRIQLSAPARVRRGQLATVRMTDTWGIGGIHVRLCATPPKGRKHCQVVAFAKAVEARSVQVRATQRGHWRLDLQVRRFHVRSTLAVGVKAVPARPLPLLLATGDSIMMGVDSALSDDLPEVGVDSEVHPGTGLTKDDWLGMAREQTKRLHQAITVISLGANEGFPLPVDGAPHDCCDEAWVLAYQRRVRTMMDIYRRGGAARVYYLTLPIPHPAGSAALVKLINEAIIRAGRDVAGVRVLRMDQLFTPDGAFQETIRDGGRTVDVREADGVHLNASGQAIAARETAKAIRGLPTAVSQ